MLSFLAFPNHHGNETCIPICAMAPSSEGNLKPGTTPSAGLPDFGRLGYIEIGALRPMVWPFSFLFFHGFGMCSVCRARTGTGSHPVGAMYKVK